MSWHHQMYPCAIRYALDMFCCGAMGGGGGVSMTSSYVIRRAYLPTLFMSVFLALGQSYDSCSDIEVSVKDMCKTPDTKSHQAQQSVKHLHVWLNVLHSPASGLRKKSMLKSMLVNKNFLTWLLIGWRLCFQPIRRQVRKFLLTTMAFNMEISIV